MTTPPVDHDTAGRLARALGTAYEVRGLIGRGGFAEVYEVWDRELERRLAVKVLRPDIAWTAGMLQRFKLETRTVAQLQHINILPIHFVGEGEGLVYYAMPYVEGKSLSHALHGTGPFSPKRTLEIAIPILDALQHAHERGLVHRDIKPDNVMLDAATGRPVLMDFGIVKKLDADRGLTQTGFVVGTPYYMSPEQALGHGDLDARADIYSMGAVLYQMVTGEPPFDGDTSQEIVGKHLAEPPPVASELNAAVPRWLSEVIVHCLGKKPADRYRSAAAVIEALKKGWEAGEPVAPPEPAVTPGHVDSLAATEVVDSAELARGTRRRAWWRRLAWGFPPAIVLVAAGVMWYARPRLIFENRLVAPVTVSLGSRQDTVQPGERVVLPLARGGVSTVTWAAERSVDTEGQPLGVEVAGVIPLGEPRGRIRRAAEARFEGQAYFAPLITNNTGQPLTVTINAGTGAAMDCGCVVPPGAVRMSIGYYPLYLDSTVRVEDPTGRHAMFTDLGPEVDAGTGVVGLRFEEENLR